MKKHDVWIWFWLSQAKNQSRYMPPNRIMMFISIFFVFKVARDAIAKGFEELLNDPCTHHGLQYIKGEASLHTHTHTHTNTHTHTPSHTHTHTHTHHTHTHTRFIALICYVARGVRGHAFVTKDKEIQDLKWILNSWHEWKIKIPLGV